MVRFTQNFNMNISRLIVLLLALLPEILLGQPELSPDFDDSRIQFENRNAGGGVSSELFVDSELNRYSVFDAKTSSNILHTETDTIQLDEDGHYACSFNQFGNFRWRTFVGNFTRGTFLNDIFYLTINLIEPTTYSINGQGQTFSPQGDNDKLLVMINAEDGVIFSITHFKSIIDNDRISLCRLKNEVKLFFSYKNNFNVITNQGIKSFSKQNTGAYNTVMCDISLTGGVDLITPILEETDDIRIVSDYSEHPILFTNSLNKSIILETNEGDSLEINEGERFFARIVGNKPLLLISFKNYNKPFSASFNKDGDILCGFVNITSTPLVLKTFRGQEVEFTRELSQENALVLIMFDKKLNVLGKGAIEGDASLGEHKSKLLDNRDFFITSWIKTGNQSSPNFYDYDLTESSYQLSTLEDANFSAVLTKYKSDFSLNWFKRSDNPRLQSNAPAGLGRLTSVYGSNFGKSGEVHLTYEVNANYINPNPESNSSSYEFNFGSIGDLLLTLNEYDVKTDSIKVEACKIYKLPNGDIIYDKSGIYDERAYINYGNDTLFNIDLTIYQPDTIIVNYTGCDSILLENNTLVFNSGTYIDTIQSDSLVCPSYIFNKVTINQSFFTEINDSLCVDSVLFDRWYKPGELYIDSAITKHDCDSITYYRFNKIFNRDTIELIYCDFYLTSNGDTILNNVNISDTTYFANSCDSITTSKITIVNLDTNITQLDEINFFHDKNLNVNSPEDSTLASWYDCNTNELLSTSYNFTAPYNGSFYLKVNGSGIKFTQCEQRTECFQVSTVGLQEQLIKEISLQKISQTFFRINSLIDIKNVSIFNVMGQRMKIITTDKFEFNAPDIKKNNLYFFYILTDNDDLHVIKFIP